MVRIDRRPTGPSSIELGSNLPGIAVGGGAVWASLGGGPALAGRARPAPAHPHDRVGAGVYVAFGDGAVWAANWNDGRSRRRPGHQRRDGRIPVCATRRWRPAPGRRGRASRGDAHGTLPATACGRSVGREAPDVIVASETPLQDIFAAPASENASAVRFVIEDHGFRAGDFVVGYQSCDDSTAQTGVHDPRRCAANAQAFAGAERLVAVVGPYNSQCAQIEVPIANSAPAGRSR